MAANIHSSIGAQGARLLCMDPTKLKGLTPEQLAALHLCKHEIISAIYRLYMVVPQDKADAILSGFVQVPPPEGAPA